MTERLERQTPDNKIVLEEVQRQQAPTRKCGCACKAECDCRCTCACPEHCVCVRPCDGKCGETKGRNLVVSIDGTSNQFGDHNTNVVEFHSRVLVDPDEEQLTYYNCGIGTYVPNRRNTFKYWRQRLDNAVDLAIAWNFENIVQKAYRWLSDVYRPKDKIFLLGFSRGAYQARTLGAMIHKVGLVNAGNQELIPYAYEIYCEQHKEMVAGQADSMAKIFKDTFSRTVKIHFIGAWDTVSSVGVAREKPLPLTASADHVCIFRHALALDECRVKFLPEYVEGGSSIRGTGNIERQSSSEHPTSRSAVAQNQRDVKEVWFAGTHSDIGGGLKDNRKLNLSSVPLLWMENEATYAGLRLRTRETGGGWNWDILRNDKPSDSMSRAWSVFEKVPVKRLSYKNADEFTWVPHLGAGRVIVPGQLIHASVAFKDKSYRPQATFLSQEKCVDWASFVGKDISTETLDWAAEWPEQVEMDLFDQSFTAEAIKKLKAVWASGEIKQSEEEHWINRLSFIALSGELAASHLRSLQQPDPEDTERNISDALTFFRKLQDKQREIFDGDIAELLESHATALDILGRKLEAMMAGEEAAAIRLRLSRDLPLTSKKDEKLAHSWEALATIWRGIPSATATPPTRALEFIKKAVALRRDLSCRQSFPPQTRDNFNLSLSRSLADHGYILYDLGQYADACDKAEEGLKLQQGLHHIDPVDLADTLYSLAILKRAAGKTDEAIKVGEEAAELRRALLEDGHESAKADLANSLHNLGYYLSEVGKHTAALKATNEAIKLRRQLALVDPSMKSQLASSLANLTFDLRELGENRAALAVDEEAMKIRQVLSAADPTDRALKKLVAQSFQDIAADFRNLKQHSDAMDPQAQAIALYRELATVDPKVKKELAESLLDLAIDQSNLKLHQQAVEFDEEAIELRRELATADQDLQRDVVIALGNLGFHLRAAGRPADALSVDNESVEILRNLALTTSDPAIQTDLANALDCLAIDFRAADLPDDSLRVHEEEVRLRRSALLPGPDQDSVKRPPVLKCKQTLANALHNLAFDLGKAGRIEEGLKAYREAIEIRNDLVADDHTVKQGLALSYHNSGVDCRTLGRHVEALNADENAVQLRRDISRADPAARAVLAISLTALAEDLSNFKRHNEAVKAVEEAAALRKVLADEDPSHTQDLLNSLVNLTFRLRDAGRREDAVDNDEHTVKLLRDLVASDPTKEADLAASLTTWATDLSAIGLNREALEVEDEAILMLRTLAKKDPIKFSTTLTSCLNNSSWRHAALGDTPTAVHIAGEAVEVERERSKNTPAPSDSDLAIALNTYAHHLSCSNRLQDGLKAIEEAVEILRTLFAVDPDKFGHTLSNVLDTYAVLQSEAGRHREGLAAVDEAERLLAEKEAPSLTRSTRAVYCAARSKCLFGMGLESFDKAIDSVFKFLELSRDVATTDPNTVDADNFGASVDMILKVLTGIDQPDTVLNAMVDIISVCRILARFLPAWFNNTLKKSLTVYADTLSRLGRADEAVVIEREATEIQVDFDVDA